MKKITTILFTIFLLILNSEAKIQNIIPAFNADFWYTISNQEGSTKIVVISDGLGDNLKHLWYADDSLFAAGDSATLFYTKKDSLIRICHKLIVNAGDTLQLCKDIFVDVTEPPAPNQECWVNFDFYADTSITDCLSAFRFTISEPLYVSQWNWDFGDGGTSNLRNPVHKYQDSGFFRVTLRILTDSGCNAEYSRFLYVRGSDECNVQIGYTPSQQSPYQIFFYCNINDIRLMMSSRTDPWDSLWFGSINYFWDFGDGNYDYTFSPVHSYLTSGTYTVKLNVHFSDGSSCDASYTDFFKGKDGSQSCTYRGVFVRNYEYQGFDAVVSEKIGHLYVKQNLSDTDLADREEIWFDYYETGDTVYSGNTIFRGVVLTCVDNKADEFYTGTVKDLSGLDGCGYVIKLDNGTTIQPVKMLDNIVFSDNLRVRLSYVPLYDVATVCMAGVPAEIIFIEGLGSGDTIITPPCKETITLVTSTVVNSNECNGTAYLAFDNCQPWMSSILPPNGYSAVWSTGETGFSATGLCPNNLYFVTVNTPYGESFTTAFSIFELNNFFPSWNYTKTDNTYYFNLPVDSNYNVEWKFDDGITKHGKNTSYTFSQGNHVVELVVKDLNGNEVYSETIELDISSDIPDYNNHGLKVFPVPADDNLTINLTGIQSQKSVRIIDMTGKTLIERFILRDIEHLTLDVSSLNSGIYIVVLSGENGISKIKFQKR